MKKIKVKCKTCGEIELSETYSDGERDIFPVVYYPTELSVAKAWKEINGETFEQATGNKFKGAFTKEFIEISHADMDEGDGEWKKHRIGKIECWIEKM